MKIPTPRKPTRRDLLVVVGRLQDLVGQAIAHDNDRNPNRQAQVRGTLEQALDLCIATLSKDPPLVRSGPFAEQNFPLDDKRQI